MRVLEITHTELTHAFHAGVPNSGISNPRPKTVKRTLEAYFFRRAPWILPIISSAGPL